MGLDSSTEIQSLKDMVQKFCEERDWDQYHGAKDLAIGAVTESSELLEHFRFQTKEQVQVIMKNSEKREEIGSEIADVAFFLLRLCQRFDFDLAECLNRKMEKNSKRYPVSEFRGKNHKSNY